jgi:hypothetical protein
VLDLLADCGSDLVLPSGVLNVHRTPSLYLTKSRFLTDEAVRNDNLSGNVNRSKGFVYFLL